MTPAQWAAARSAVEMSADRAVHRRIARLALVSAVALGIIWDLARRTPGLGSTPAYLLQGAWVLMPAVLLMSLARPRLRYALVVPATLVTTALVALCLESISGADESAAGWILVTSGVLTGDILGLWFWFRFFPVPSTLKEPFSPRRWSLVGIHVALVVAGLLLIAAGR